MQQFSEKVIELPLHLAQTCDDRNHRQHLLMTNWLKIQEFILWIYQTETVMQNIAFPLFHFPNKSVSLLTH